MNQKTFQSEDAVSSAIQAENERISALMTQRHHQRVAHTRSMPIDPSLVLPLNVLAQSCSQALEQVRAHSATQTLGASAQNTLTQSVQRTI